MENIYQAIAAIMQETDAITKDRKNQQQGYSFRGIDDVYNAVHPLFAKHGVFSVPTVLDDKTEERTTKNGAALIYRVLKMKYTFFASDGSFIESVVIGEGMDSGDKASNKAMAVAHKYAIMQILSIPTDDPKDPENQNHEVAPKAAPRHQEPPARSGAYAEVLNDIKTLMVSGVFTEKEVDEYRAACKGASVDELRKVLSDAKAAAEKKPVPGLVF